MVLTACLLAPDARAAGESREATISPPHATAERTIVNLGVLVFKLQTSSIALGLADEPGGPVVPSFAAARSAGAFSVTGTARASLTLTLDLGDPLNGREARIPVPLRGIARAAQASLALDGHGKIRLNLGTSFGFNGFSRGVPVAGGALSLSTDVLKPWKHTVLRYHLSF